MGASATELRLGCAPDLPLQRLQTFLGALYAYDPQVQVEVVLRRTAAQLADLLAGTLDAGLLHDPGQTESVELAPVFPGERLAIVAPLAHASAPAPPLHRRTLRLFPRAVDPELHDRLLASVQAAGHVFGRVVETGGDDLRDVLLAVAEGGGVAVAPASTLEIAGELGTFLGARALDPPVWMPRTMVAWSRERSPELEAARHAARELRADW